MKPVGHWGREKAVKMTSADYRHERSEPFGYECKEHGLTMPECEKALLNAQKDKYKDSKKSRFHL